MDFLAIHRRRLAAAQRSELLYCPECRSTYSDPWTHTCGLVADPPSEAQIGAWAKTVDALLDLNMTPVVPAEVARALWNRGDDHRELIRQVADRGGVI